ncbi:hypothetical protein MTR_1g030050 [Medicago truncatula]|uniref:Uncharacterized protein n=1 Tax=Medicago truncatula TaxID=3880 RepID=A0A072VQW7_MEDTR|nr:hypothetical protein MTR_1g030050 [Medicago truncatula]
MDCFHLKCSLVQSMQMRVFLILPDLSCNKYNLNIFCEPTNLFLEEGVIDNLKNVVVSFQKTNLEGFRSTTPENGYYPAAVGRKEMSGVVLVSVGCGMVEFAHDADGNEECCRINSPKRGFASKRESVKSYRLELLRQSTIDSNQ